MRGRGLALAAGYRMGQRQAEEQGAQQQMAPQAQAAPAAAPAEEDLTSKIERLAELHRSGALTDEEFAAAKQKILG
jgi:membrane protease subunit (stomatin/prohibitin family)